MYVATLNLGPAIDKANRQMNGQPTPEKGTDQESA